MGAGEKRLNINGLVPGEKYAIQVRAVDNGSPSDWSQKYHIETIDDTAGGTRTPEPPTLKYWAVDASGQYTAKWDSVLLNTDGSPLVVRMYELELESNIGTVVVPHYAQTATEQNRSFNFGNLRGMFAGQIPTSITARMRVVNSAGTISEWSNEITASLPVPNPPRNVIGKPVTDAIKLTWEPPLDPIHLFGYRVYLGFTPDFVIDNVGRQNLVYQGPSLEFSYASASYLIDHYFKVVSYSEPGLESTFVEPVPTPLRPKSPYGPDDIPPLVPDLSATVTMNSTRTSAELTWTFDALLDQNTDISGFVIAYQMSGETTWRNAYFSNDARSGIIDIPRPFANYKFKIAAYDFVGNYSAFGPERTLAGTTSPPNITTGVQAAAGLDNLRITWDASTSESVLSGGSYQVQFRASNSFPADTPIEYTVRDPFLQVSGLAVNTPYWFRVRAVDSANQTGPWSTVATKSTNNFPTDPTSDGIAPTLAPTSVKAIGGLNFVNVSWNTVLNDDATWYEVHMSTTNNFTPSGATKVAEAWGTSSTINSTQAGADLVQNTVYYFKVAARDKDGLGPYSAQASDTLKQVASSDLGINMSGENLLINSSYEADATSDGLGDYWQVVNNSPGPNPTTTTLVTGRTGGLAQRISWTGVNGANIKGIKGLNQSQLRPNTEYVFSVYARASAGTGFDFTLSPVASSSVVVTSLPPSSTVWNRYVYRFTTGNTVDPDNGTISIAGHTANGGWIEFDDAQLEAGNVASAYKTGTVSIAKLTSGRMSTAEMIVDANGIVKSSDYNTGTKTGWAIHNGGIDLFKGQVLAERLVADSSITSNLFVKAKLEMSNNGYIQNAGYSDGSVTPAAGYRITKDIIDIRSGIISVGTLIGGTISAATINLGVNAKMVVDQASAAIQSNNWNPTGGPTGGPLGFKISNTGITMDENSSINVNALVSSTLTSTDITLGSGGTIRSKDWVAAGPVRWQLSETGLTMYGGTIQGATIITDQIYSAQSESMNGVNRKKFSINAQGYAEFSGAYIYGNAIVGDGDQHFVQSANYAGSGTGWKIYGNGNADFKNATMGDATVYGTAVIGAAWGSGFLRSSSYSAGSAGFMLYGDGRAEFNNGDFRVGAADGSAIRMYGLPNGAPTPGAQIRLYRPGDSDGGQFAIIRSRNDAVFEVRGPVGGAIELYGPWFTGRSRVKVINDIEVPGEIRCYSGMTLNGGINIQQGGLGVDNGINVRTGNVQILSAGLYVDGDVTFNKFSGGGQRYLLVNNSGALERGASPSSRDIKKNIEPLDVDYKSILELEPKQYHFKEEDGTGPKSVGFIAEEARDAGLDKWVASTSDGVLGFDYPFFVVALQQVARGQEKQIQSQQEEIKELQRQVKKLMLKS